MRLGAAQSLSVFPPEEQFSQARHLLKDDLLAIRVEAAGALLDVPRTSIPSDGQQLLDQAIREYRSVQEFNADHPSAHMNLGNLALRARDFAAAEAEYRKSIQLEPAFMLTLCEPGGPVSCQGRGRERGAGLERGPENESRLRRRPLCAGIADGPADNERLKG